MTPLPSDPAGRIRSHLSAARRRLALGDLLSGFLWTLGVTAAAWAFAAGLEAVLWAPSAVRGVLLTLALAAPAGVLVHGVVWPALRWSGIVSAISDDAVAVKIGRRLPEVGDRLLNLLQLLDGRHSASPAPLVRSAADHLGSRLQDTDLRPVEDFARVRRAGRLATLPVAGLLAFALVAPDAFLGASGRLLSPGIEFGRPAPFHFQVLPGNVELVKGADLPVEVRIEGTGIPTGILLETRYADETVTELLDVPVSDGRAEHTVVNLRRTLQYRATSGGVSSDWYLARVVDRPVIGNLQLVLRYPAYTRMPPLALAPNEGDVTALAGTEALVETVIGGPEVSDAEIAFQHGSPLPMAIEGRAARGSFRVTRDDAWHIEAVSADGVENVNPVVYDIRRVPDAFPSVVITSPETESDLDESATVLLSWRISDDFGFTRLRLFHRLASSRFGTPSDTFTPLDLPLVGPDPREQDGAHEWILGKDPALDPAPGDVIAYYLEVQDNDGFSGPKAARTDEYRLRMPSLTERYEDLDESGDVIEEELEEVTQEAERVREAFEELEEQLRGKPESDWQDERAVERLREQQESLEESVRDIADRIESLNQDMERNDLVGEETLQLFQELQKVAEEINSPELMEALRELQEAMQQMDLERMQQALEDFDFNEDQYRQRLERTLELFRNLRVQQDLDEASRRAEELARTEEELAERTEELAREEQETAEQDSSRAESEESSEEGDDRAEEERTNDSRNGEEPPDAGQLGQEQERAAEDMEALEEMLREIQEQMEGLRQAPSESMQELSRQTESQEMPQQMRQNAEQLQNQQFGPAQESQQKMSEQLRNLQQQLQQMLAGMQGSQLEVNLSGLRRALDDVLALSEDQETLRATVQLLADESPGLRESARRQVRLSEGLATVSDSLQSLARQIPQMGRDIQTRAGEAQREMGDAMQAMTDRTSRRAVGHQKGAMTGLNELALLLADLMNQMSGGGGGSGSMSMQQMMQQLQNMAGQQQMLNDQLQQMLNDIRGNRLSSDSRERLRQLGEQQQRIREQLQELNRNPDLRNQALGDLERLAEQMQETIEELTLRQITPRTIERQRQILTRLLEASRSLQERGRDRRRESRTGEDVGRTGPPDLSPSERVDRLRRDLVRALESGYAPDFEELIRRYFDLLQEDAARPASGAPTDSTGQ